MASTQHLISIKLALEDGLSKPLSGATNSLKEMGASLTSIGTQMTAAFTLPIVAAGAAGVKMATDLDKSMRNIQSITKQTDESLSVLSSSLVALSTDMSKTTDSATNLADAYYQIISSGVDATDAMKVLEVATKAASAGLTTTEVAAKGIITVLNSYKLGVEDASRVSDILFETVNRGVGTFEELNSSLSNVIPTASIMGISLEEVSAGMATLSKNGFSFSEASVAMNGAMNALLSPTKAMQSAISEMGYSSGQAMVDALGFAGAMQRIAEYTGGSSEELARLFPEIRGFRAAAILAGNGAESFAQDLAAMTGSAGATQAAFAEQMKSFDASFKNFQNTLNALLIDVGQTIMPVLAAVMNFLTPIIQGFMALPTPIKQIILVILALVAAIGPLLIIIGQVIGAISAIGAIIPIVTGAFTAFLALGAPVIALIGLVIAAIVLLITNWQNLGDTVSQIGTLIVEGWKRLFTDIGTTIGQIGQLIWEGLNRLSGGMLQLGANIIEGLINGIKSKAVDLVAYVFGLSKELTAAIKTALGIHSPSKVMEGLGKNVVQGFHKGIESLGGIGVDVPQVSRGGNGQPSLAMAGGGGGATVQNFNIYPPIGTGKEQVDYIYKEISKRMADDAKRRGARPQ